MVNVSTNEVRITVLHKLRNNPEQGTDHFILDVLILSEAQRRAAARCVEDIVVYDYRTAKKSPLPPFMIDKFKQTFELQEAAIRYPEVRPIRVVAFSESTLEAYREARDAND